jgi:hypothetical protein
VRYTQASVFSGAIVAELVISAILTWLILSERPGFATILGGAVVLAGLFLLLRGYESPEEPHAEPVARGARRPPSLRLHPMLSGSVLNLRESPEPQRSSPALVVRIDCSDIKSRNRPRAAPVEEIRELFR